MTRSGSTRRSPRTLQQAAETFARVRPDAACGFYTGNQKDGEADLVFASVQTLIRPRHLEAFASDAFDYVVIDEFHHADAPTYRCVIEYFEPKFLLGLTAAMSSGSSAGSEK